MSIRLYVQPIEADEEGSHRGPKYLAWSRDPDPSDNVGETSWSMLGYGLFTWGIAAVEAGDAVHAALAGKVDVQQIPANLDSTVGSPGARDAARAFLEQAGLPGNWITVNDTWRAVVRTVCGFMLFAQRYDSIRQQAQPGAPSLGSQIDGNLNVQWSNIPAGIRAAVMETGDSFGYDLSFITDSMIVRNVLKQLADLWGEQPVRFGLEEFNGGSPFTV